MGKHLCGDFDALPADFITTVNGDCRSFTPTKILLNNQCLFAVETEPVISSAFKKCATLNQLADNISTVREDQKHYLNFRYINEVYTLWITVDALPDERPVPKAIKRLPGKCGAHDPAVKPAVIVWPSGRTQPLIGCQVRHTTPEDLERVRHTRIEHARHEMTPHRVPEPKPVAPPAPKGVQNIDDFKSLVIDGNPIDLSSRPKVRSVLRFLYNELKGKTDKSFLVDDMREKFNAQFDKDTAGRRWRCDRLREDLFKGMPAADFERLFEAIDRPNQRYRLKI